MRIETFEQLINVGASRQFTVSKPTNAKPETVSGNNPLGVQIKMRQLLYIILFSPLLILGQNTKHSNLSQKIQEYYIKAKNDKDSAKYKLLFFNTFPNNFKDFNKLFGYTDNSYGPLYDGLTEITFFYNLDNINDTTFYNKIVNISIGGQWYADGVNYFQSGLRKKVFSKPNLTCTILSKRSDNEIKSFWFFFYHSIHSEYKTIPDKLKSLETENKRIYDLMLQGLTEALKQNGH